MTLSCHREGKESSKCTRIVYSDAKERKHSETMQEKKQLNFRMAQLHKTEPCPEWEFPVKLRNYSVNDTDKKGNRLFSLHQTTVRDNKQIEWYWLNWGQKKSISRLGANVNAGGSTQNDQWVYLILETPRISYYTKISLKWSTSRGHSKNNGSWQYPPPPTHPNATSNVSNLMVNCICNATHETSRIFHLGKIVTVV